MKCYFKGRDALMTGYVFSNTFCRREDVFYVALKGPVSYLNLRNRLNLVYDL